MKLTRQILVVVMILAATVAVNAQTVADVAQRAVDAMGGQAKLESIETLSMTMNGTMQGSMEIKMDMKIKKPDMFHMDMNMMGQNMTMVSNGESIWMEMMGRTMDVPTEQAASNKQLTQGFGDLVLQLEQMGATYAGTEEFNGESCHVIEYTPEGSAEKAKLFFSTSSGLMMGTAQETDQGNVEMMITEYQDVSGMTMPKSMVVNMNGSPMMNMEISNIQINPTLDDSLFTR